MVRITRSTATRGGEEEGPHSTRLRSAVRGGTVEEEREDEEDERKREGEEDGAEEGGKRRRSKRLSGTSRKVSFKESDSFSPTSDEVASADEGDGDGEDSEAEREVEPHPNLRTQAPRGSKGRRSKRLSFQHHKIKSFIVDDDPMDEKRGDEEYLESEDEQVQESKRKGDIKARLRSGKDMERDGDRMREDEDAGEEEERESEAEGDEEDEGDLSAANLVRLGEKDPSQLISQLIVKEKADILLLDEDSSYSMLLAFAALRRSFEGLWCSRIDETEFKPVGLIDRLDENWESAIRKGGHKGCGYGRVGAPKGRWCTHLKQSLSELSQVDLARLDLNFWAHQLEAASSAACSSPLSVASKFPLKYIWLNPPSSPHLAGNEGAYLKKFLVDCASIQPEGGCVFVTLPVSGESRDEVEEWERLGEELKSLGERFGYRHFEDRSFVRDECVHNGYHSSKGEEMWTTLIFVKVKTPAEMPTLDEIGDIEGLPTTRPRERFTVVMEVDSEPIPPASSTAAADTALPTIIVARPQASTPEPSQPPSGSVIPSPPPSPLASSSSVRRSSRQHGPLLYGTYRDVPLAEDGDVDMGEEQQEGKKEKGSQPTKITRVYVDVPSSRAVSSSSRGSTASVTRKAGNKAQGQTTLKGAFSSQKRTNTGTAAKRTPSQLNPTPTSVSTSTSKGKERERELERERVETTVTISSMVIEMGKGYRVGGGGGDRGSGGWEEREEREREEEREEAMERELSPEYLPPSPPAAKRRRLADTEGLEEGPEEEREEEAEEMEVDPPQSLSRPRNEVNAEEEAQARDFLNFQDENEEMDQDPPPPTSEPSREYQSLKRLKRAGSFASGEGEGEGEGGGSVHSSHATLVPSPSTSPPAAPGPAAAASAAPAASAVDVDVDVDVNVEVEVDGPAPRRSKRQREKETNMERFHRKRAERAAAGLDEEEGEDEDEEKEGGQVIGGRDHDDEDDEDMGGDDDEDDSEHGDDEDDDQDDDLLPLHPYVSLEARDAGFTYANVNRYGTEYGQGRREQTRVELVDVELE